ncbi:MAG: metal ABC transporter ATP-binding protein [Planctomycetota bacterium]
MNDWMGDPGDVVIGSNHLTVVYGAEPALWNVSVSIPRRGITGVIGPNGAGKSTLIKAILGIVPKAAGECRVQDDSGTQLMGDAIGYVPQRSTVDWDFPTSVFDVVMMGTYGRLRWFQRPGKLQRQQTADALDFVGLSDLAGRQIGELSGGQQQRVFLARAFVQHPSVYLMDEPFAGVDAKTERNLFQILRRIADDGATIVMVHHDLMRVHDYFDNVVLLNRRLIDQGPTKTIFNSDNLESCYGVDAGFLTA